MPLLWSPNRFYLKPIPGVMSMASKFLKHPLKMPKSLFYGRSANSFSPLRDTNSATIITLCIFFHWWVMNESKLILSWLTDSPLYIFQVNALKGTTLTPTLVILDFLITTCATSPQILPSSTGIGATVCNRLTWLVERTKERTTEQWSQP